MTRVAYIGLTGARCRVLRNDSSEHISEAGIGVFLCSIWLQAVIHGLVLQYLVVITGVSSTVTSCVW